MKKILVTYATNAGSTAVIAELVKDSLVNKEIAADLKPVAEVGNIAAYDAVIVGAPMIVGWHRAAKKFLRAHRTELATKPFACFLTAMSLTETRETVIDGIPIQVDPGLAKAPRNPKFLSIKEGYAFPANYVRPILRAAPELKPLGYRIIRRLPEPVDPQLAGTPVRPADHPGQTGQSSAMMPSSRNGPSTSACNY